MQLASITNPKQVIHITINTSWKYLNLIIEASHAIIGMIMVLATLTVSIFHIKENKFLTVTSSYRETLRISRYKSLTESPTLMSLATAGVTSSTQMEP